MMGLDHEYTDAFGVQQRGSADGDKAHECE